MNIVFVTNGSFGTRDATGSMLNNIFEGIDCRILQYSLRPQQGQIIDPISTVSMMSEIRYSVFSRIVAYCNTVRYKEIRFWRILKSLNVYLDSVLPPILSKKEITTIKAFFPDVIYTLAGDVKVLRVSRILARRLGKPIVIHNMDDFFNMDLHSSNIFRRYLNKILRREYIKAYKYSNKSLGIGPKMAQEYSEEFGIPFDWVMNCVDTDKIRVDKRLNDNLALIIFSGGLHGGRVHSLVKIASIVEELGDIKLDIYTSKKEVDTNNRLFECFKHTELREYVEKDKMFENLSRADVLLHVESFEPQNIRYFRLSMSTKIPEYMASRRPILCVGPSGIATVEFIKEYRIGHVVHDVDKFDDAILEMQNVDYRGHLVVNATCCLNEYFTKLQMQQKLINVFDINMSKNKPSASL